MPERTDVNNGRIVDARHTITRYVSHVDRKVYVNGKMKRGGKGRKRRRHTKDNAYAPKVCQEEWGKLGPGKPRSLKHSWRVPRGGECTRGPHELSLARLNHLAC